MKTIFCDSCGSDLTKLETIEDYRVTLKEEYPLPNGVIEDSEHYFCDLECLRTWMKKELKHIPEFKDL